jgi:hypothetical protein
VSPRDARVPRTTGTITARLDVRTEEAFIRLRSRALAEQRPLSGVARRLSFAGRSDQW